MANKELYIGTATPKSNEVVWIRPLKSGGVALYAYVYNKWQVLKLVNGKGTLPVDDDEVIDPATPGGNYYTKDEIDGKIADILGIDADQIDELIKIITDNDTITGLLTELKNKASLDTDNVFTGSNTFLSNGLYRGKIFIRDGEIISTNNIQDGNDLSHTARLGDTELSFYDYNSSHGDCQTHVYYNGSLGNSHLKVNTLVGHTYKEEILAYMSDIPTVTPQVQSDWNEADTTKKSFIKNKPTIPTKISDLTNDSGFIGTSVNNLTNYYLKTDTYSKSEVDAMIGDIETLLSQI